MRAHSRVAVAGAAIFILLAVVPDADAVPAFARQTGASCNACHFQHFPALTAYGRVFKAGGFTTAGGQSLVEGKHLSFPGVLNASVVTKIRYVKTNGTTGAGTDMGELQFPDEAAVWLGGRVGTHVGFVLEAQLADPDAPMFASYKMPIGLALGDGRLSAVPFSTDALGAPFGFELLNTGAVRNARVMEDRAAISAQQYVVAGGDEGAAQGLAFAFSHRYGFLSVTPWSADHGTVAMSKPAWYVRAAATPTVGTWELAGGVQWWAGRAQSLDRRTRAWALDGQAQGHLGEVPIGLYLAYANAEASPAGGGSLENLFNPELRAQSAFSAMAEVGVLPSRATVGLGYRRGDNGRAVSHTDGAVLLGGTFLMAQNVQLQVNHIYYHGDAYAGAARDQRTILMLFAAF